jgi:hypothetical protein
MLSRTGLACDRQRVEIEQIGDLLHDRGNAAGVAEILHQKAA